MSSKEAAKLSIEPFDPERHDRDGFSCGVEQVDNFFKLTANKLTRADNLRVFVMVASERSVIGFYALNAHAVRYEELPAKFARTRPSHGTIPAAYISMIGLDQRFSGHGYGGDLLIDALKRISRAADTIGIAVVMLDVLDDGKEDLVAKPKSLYEGYGFAALPSNPLRLFLPVETVRKLIEI